MSNFWTEEETKIALDLMQEDRISKEISEALRERGFHRSPSAVRNHLRRYSGEEPETYQEHEEETINIDYFQETLEKIRALRDNLVKVTSDKFVKVGRPVNPNVKVLTLSDFHIPFENPDVIKHALENHLDADILVLNGDILDHYMVSKWPQKKAILLKWEYQLAVEWLKLFSNAFKKVILTLGNHEHRLQSYFHSNVDPAVHFLTSPDILKRLSDGYDFNEEGFLVKTHDFSNIHYDAGVLNWYTIIGKCIFAHPRSFSSVPMRTTINAANNFLDREDYQCLVMGHTHKIGQIIWRNKLLIEQGCCCVPLDYEADGKLRFGPQSFGYAIVYLDKKGNVDFNKTRYIYYGTGTAVKVDDALKFLNYA
jgi:predicted phosphodiesterase